MMLKAVTFIVSTLMSMVGALLVLAATNVVEYGGAAVLLGGGIAGVWGLLRKLADDRKVSDYYGNLVKQLQDDNDRLRRALRDCEERR